MLDLYILNILVSLTIENGIFNIGPLQSQWEIPSHTSKDNSFEFQTFLGNAPIEEVTKFENWQPLKNPK